MNDKTFPTYNTQRKTGNKGVTLVKCIVEDELEWIFRPSHLEDDFGLDGYFDIIGSDNSVTGKFLGVQIKTGESYFSSATSAGWKYVGENKHLNYFLNSDFAIILVVVNLSSKTAYWVEFDSEVIEKTKKGWSIVVPKANVLGLGSKPTLQGLAGHAIDYMEQLEYQWEMNRKIKESSFVYIQISREEIVNKDVSGFTRLLKRLTISDEMILKTRGKISFFIDGFNSDQRELYEIKEVRDWVAIVLPEFKYWGYFLNMEPYLAKLAGLRVLHLCSVDVTVIDYNKTIGMKNITFDIEESCQLMEKLFNWLNEFCELYSISDAVNEEQSEKIGRLLITGEGFS
jgi:hypothetical protein